MLAPLASGDAIETELTERLLLNPPPFGCEGGCSRVVPWTVVVPPRVNGTTTALEVRGLRSAVPDGDGKVDTSITRKRNRVMS